MRSPLSQPGRQGCPHQEQTAQAPGKEDARGKGVHCRGGQLGCWCGGGQPAEKGGGCSSERRWGRAAAGGAADGAAVVTGLHHVPTAMHSLHTFFCEYHSAGEQGGTVGSGWVRPGNLAAAVRRGTAFLALRWRARGDSSVLTGWRERRTPSLPQRGAVAVQECCAFSGRQTEWEKGKQRSQERREMTGSNAALKQMVSKTMDCKRK